MWKVALVGAVALATVSVVPAGAQNAPAPRETKELKKLDYIITENHIHELKSLLRLKPEQETYWPAVEEALQGLVQEQEREVERSMAMSMSKRIVQKVSSAAGEVMALKRVLSAARPLVQALDEEQKRDVLKIARTLGIEKLAAAL